MFFTSQPLGDGWLHEVKFDGYRIQLHKFPGTVSLYSKGGLNFTRKFPELADAVAASPVLSCVIDGELTACDQLGIPDFRSPHFNSRADVRCVWLLTFSTSMAKMCAPFPSWIARKPGTARVQGS